MTLKAKQHDKKLREMNADHKSTLHAIDRKKISMKAAEGDTGAILEVGENLVPTDKQLGLINQYTRKTVGKDDVVAFPTMSCNDLYDRDDEKFTTDTVKGFAELQPPYGPNGKSFMVDHEYKMANAKGRIFDTATKKVDGVTFLVNDIYVPKTPQYADFIESIDFGVNWAVSVGVVIDKANCSICEAPVYQSRFFGAWCENGHDKGYFYDPTDDEKDAWGYFIPCDPDTPGAVKAMVDLSDPIDFYELSQVFLGAQYMAELAKRPDFKGMMKAASVHSIPVIGLSAKESAEIPVPHEPEEVQKAREKKYKIVVTEDGDPTWVDDQGLKWIYTNDEAMCLGRSAEDGEEQEGAGSPDDGEVVRADGQEVGGSDDDADEAELGSGEAADGSSGSSGQQAVEDEEVDKEAVIALARSVKLPGTIVDKVQGAADNGLSTLLAAVSEHITTLETKNTELSKNASLGEKYIAAKRADCIQWYVKAHQEADKPVSTETFMKILDRCGDDVELLEAVMEEQKSLAQAKFPTSVRRSTFESDPNAVPEVKEAVNSKATASTAQRIHR